MIKLIVGLGNPGKEYLAHRHNVGFWFVDQLAKKLSLEFGSQSKFFGETAETLVGKKKVRLLKPQTFMNCSGKSIQALAAYFGINANEILVIHDELDLNPGNIKIKLGGGHGGHNGLRDVIKSLDAQDFYRLRVGIGHPGTKNEVVNFVLSPATKKELALIECCIDEAIGVMGLLVEGEIEEATKSLHTN